MSWPASADSDRTAGELTTAARRTLTIALFAMLAVATVVIVLCPPGAERIREGTLTRPFAAAGGLAVTAPVAFPGDSSAAPTTSRLELFEDGRPLGPAHALHDAIRATGGGAFSHWGDGIVFSAADDSDPNANGRVYTYRARVLASPALLVAGALGLGTVAAFGLWLLVIDRMPRRLRGLIAAAGSIAITLAAVELAAWATLQRELFDADVAQLRTYAWITGDASALRIDGRVAADGLAGTDTVATFAPHPFLNFALDPNAAYMGVRQFDADYLIRRGEPLRPRADVTWRALVLGGSTTFGVGIRREEDTWVHRLETRLRGDYGPGVDVVNGGVGGYALVDNLLHYTLLLDGLHPDVVVLFTGINDVHPRLVGDVRPDFRNIRIPWAGGESRFVDALARFAFLRSVRLYLLLRVKAGALGHIYSAVQRPYPAVAEWSAALARNGPEVYREHLAFAVSLFEARGAKVVILPQVWMPRDANDGDVAFGRGVAEHNAVNEALADAEHLPYFAHLLDPGRFTRSDLFDACHFTVPGQSKMADAVHDFLVAAAVLPSQESKGAIRHRR